VKHTPAVDLSCPSNIVYCVVDTAQISKHPSHISQTVCQGRMTRTVCLFPKRERPIEKRLSQCGLVLLVVEPPNVVKATGDAGVLRAERRFEDRQRPLDERLGLGVFALVAVEPPPNCQGPWPL